MALLSPAIDSYDVFFISQKPDFKKKKKVKHGEMRT